MSIYFAMEEDIFRFKQINSLEQLTASSIMHRHTAGRVLAQVYSLSHKGHINNTLSSPRARRHGALLRRDARARAAFYHLR